MKTHLGRSSVCMSKQRVPEHQSSADRSYRIVWAGKDPQGWPIPTLKWMAHTGIEPTTKGIISTILLSNWANPRLAAAVLNLCTYISLAHVLRRGGGRKLPAAHSSYASQDAPLESWKQWKSVPFCYISTTKIPRKTTNQPQKIMATGMFCKWLGLA